MNSITRQKPCNAVEAKRQPLYWKICYRDRFGEVSRYASINSELGAHDWADQLNEESPHRIYWVEPDYYPPSYGGKACYA
jgi:hypothetical protein